MNILNNYGNYERYNTTPFYLDAFMTEIQTTWSNTPYETEFNNIGYYRALSAMLRDSEVGEYQRRQLLRAYLKPNFDYETPDAPINKYFPTMSSDNLYIKRALRNLCVVYNEKPSREIIGSNNELMTEVYNKLNFDARMLKLHRIAKFTNEVAVTLQFINYEPVIKFITPDNYRLKYDSYGQVIGMWIPFYIYKDDKPELHYKVWTNESYKVLDTNLLPIVTEYNGKLATEHPNAIGEIPYVFISLDGDKDESLEQYGSGLFELMKSQIICNKLDFLTAENLDYNGFAVWVMQNFGVKANRIKLNPGRVLLAENVNENDGMYPPSISTVQPQGQYLDIEELKSTKIKKTLKNLSLPTSLIEDNPGLASSGVAMKVDRMELEEVRKEDIGTFRVIEDLIINKFAKILNFDYSSKYKGKFKGIYSTELDYIEQSQFLELDKEYEYNKQLFTDGLISPLMLISRTVSNDTITTNEEAIAYINENLNFKKELYGNVSGADQQINPEEHPIETGAENQTVGGTGENTSGNNTEIE